MEKRTSLFFFTTPCFHCIHGDRWMRHAAAKNSTSVGEQAWEAKEAAAAVSQAAAAAAAVSAATLVEAKLPGSNSHSE
jgi:hypothetical protein